MTFCEPSDGRFDADDLPPAAATGHPTAFASVRLDAATPQRWRNGGGWTRELLAWPPGADWRVRVSVAEIEADGPFSVFTGVRRWFCVLSGGGVELTVDGRSQRLEVGTAPFGFDGGATTDCRLLDGPTRDLNLMVRDGPGSMTAVRPGRGWTPPPGPCGLYAAVDGFFEGLPVAAHTLLWFVGAPSPLVFERGGVSHGPAGWWLAAANLAPAA